MIGSILVMAGLLATSAEPVESPWLTDYAQAREVARKENKPIFLIFRCEH